MGRFSREESSQRAPPFFVDTPHASQMHSCRACPHSLGITFELVENLLAAGATGDCGFVLRFWFWGFPIKKLFSLLLVSRTPLIIRTVFGSVWGGFLGGILGGIARAGFSHRESTLPDPLN